MSGILVVGAWLLFGIWYLGFGISQWATFAAASENELNHYLIQGRIQYDNSRYEKAIEWFDKALEVDPYNKEALRYKKKALEKLAKQHGKDIGATFSPRQRKSEKYITQGKKYYAERRYVWALSNFKKALKIDPENKEKIENYIQRTEDRLKQKPTEQKPVEADMLVNGLATQIAKPEFEKPTKDVLSLEDAMELGLKNHLPIKIALEQIKLARFKEREAFRELFPQATVRWDESSGTISNKDYVGRKYQLKMQHPLYHGGEIRYTWEQARVNLKIAMENYEKTKEDYLLELTKAYYDYVKGKRNFDVQDVLLKELENDLATAKKEYEAGLTTLVEFLNVQSQYNQAYYSYLSSKNSLSLAKSNFLQLLNLDQDPTIDIKVNTDLTFSEQNIDLEECIKLAYENRSDLKINELSLKAAEFGEKVAKSQQVPKIDLTGTIGRSGEVNPPRNLQMSDEWFLGAKVSVPWGPNTMNYSYTKESLAPTLTVFQPTKNEIHSVRFNILDNLASYTEAKRSDVTKQQAYSDYIKGKQTAATQVREAYFDYQESMIKVKNSIANKELYKKELDIIKEKRLMNEAQTQDVVSAKVKLAGEEVNYNSTLVENVIALAKLNKAIGIKNHFK